MKRGEIWEVETGKSELALCVVIAEHERVSTVLLLSDESKSCEDIEVYAKSMVYTNPAMISYKFNNCFVNFVKAMRDDEFAKLKGIIAKKLGLIEEPKERVVATAGMIDDLKMKLEGAERELDKERTARTVNENALKLTIRNLKEENDELKNHVTSVPAEVVKLKAQVEMLERQNEKLLDRLIG